MQTTQFLFRDQNFFYQYKYIFIDYFICLLIKYWVNVDV